MIKLKLFISSLLPRDIVVFIKYLYQQTKRICRGRRLIETQLVVNERKKKKEHTFFGYYDLQPLNVNGKDILFLRVKKLNEPGCIVLSSIDKTEEKIVGQTFAWNWQQGTRLRWMPNDSRKFFYNDFDGTKYFSKIVDVDTNESKIIDYPLYDISPDGRTGLSLNFERLGVMRPGYGYTCRPYLQQPEKLVEEGIDMINISDNTCNRILTYSRIAHAMGKDELKYENKYLNHISFSPSGKKFLFFWITAEESGWHDASLLVYNHNTDELKVLEKEKKVSHYVWLDDDNIICTAIDRNNKCKYYKYTVSSGKREILVPDVLNSDGHPSYIGDNTILTDTYPDKEGYQQLYLVNYKTGTKRLLLSVFQNCLHNGEERTDLHPRISLEKNIVFIDANPEGYRKFVILELDGINV